jgi:excisionase family DNA binding protein
MNTINYYTVQEVADLLNLSNLTIRRHIQAGKIPGFYKIGRKWRLDKIDYEKFIKEVKQSKQSTKYAK